MLTFREWYRLSQPFLDPTKPHGDYFAMLLAQLAKVRVPKGEGAITKALEDVSGWDFFATGAEYDGRRTA
jgi:hypothetical protein